LVIDRAAGFASARIPFILLAGLVPVFTAWLAYRLFNDRKKAILAGVLGILPGFYLAYYPTTDTFVLTMLLGCSFMLLAGQCFNEKGVRLLAAVGLGAVAGLMHMARADGFLWLGYSLAVLLVVWLMDKERGRSRIKQLAYPALTILCAYALVVTPWMARNLTLFHSLMPPGGSKGLWLRSYNELYLYPVSGLDFQHWWTQGLQSILADRAAALWSVLKTFLGVQTSIFMLPLILAGFWRLRRNPLVVTAGTIWIATFLIMSIVFPYSGSRGGFFHSGAALQPFLWALAVAGLQACVDWGSRARGWVASQAMSVFSFGLVALALLVTGMTSYELVIGPQSGQLAWNAAPELSVKIEQGLQADGGLKTYVVMVNDPPSYYVATGRQAIAIPEGGMQAAQSVAEKYDARYFVLEVNHPAYLDGLYTGRNTPDWLKLVGEVSSAKIFRIVIGQ
jgi:hypothetical protein